MSKVKCKVMVCSPGVLLSDPHSLTTQTRRLLQSLQLFAQRVGIQPPMILSGFRSEAEQIALQERWDRGDRAGIAVRPASNSPHTRGEAFDLANLEADLILYGHEAERLGYGWGGRFFPRRDPRHFYILNGGR